MADTGATKTTSTAIATVTRGAGQLRRWGVSRARRVQGWKIDTPDAFQEAVTATARFVESHPQLPAGWQLGRNARVQALNALMQEVLLAKCGNAVWVDVMTDDDGAIGEAHMGLMIASFRINLRRGTSGLSRKL